MNRSKFLGYSGRCPPASRWLSGRGSNLAAGSRRCGNRNCICCRDPERLHEGGYGPRQAAHGFKKLRGRQMVERIGRTHRYQATPTGLKAIAALVTLREKAIRPLLAAAQEIRPSRGSQNPTVLDRH
jgi:hypothetical protein